MAVAALAAWTAAQGAYDLAYQYAERRHHPPGGGDVNQRQLEAALAQSMAKWALLETAQINYVNKNTFANEQEKTEEIGSWLDKKTAHDDWVGVVEAKIQEMSLENAPPTIPVLTPTQKLERVTADIRNKQSSLVDRVQTSLEDNTIRLTKPLLENYTKACDKVMEKLEGELTALHVEREQMDPVNWINYKDSVHTYTEDLVGRVCNLRTILASKESDRHRADSGRSGDPGGGVNAPNCYKEYKKEELPTYKGDIRGYPPFKREWTRLVAPGRSEDWQLQALQKRTPEEIDLTNCLTVQEA